MRQSDAKLIVNLTSQSLVCDRGVIADRAPARMRGLLGRSALLPGEGLLLRPAPSIHTAFMRFAIDAVFLDSELTIVKLVPHLKPWRAASARDARAVLELADGEITRLCLAVGQQLATRDYVTPPALCSPPANRSRHRRSPEAVGARR
jgi:uncharacterized membrane protein (UPF0127 family)